MPTPGEQKTVQARILEYAEAIGWTLVSRATPRPRAPCSGSFAISDIYGNRGELIK